MSEALPTVREVVDKHRNLIGDTVAEQLIAYLINREDLIADVLRVAGSQLGTFPEFVAKVLADAGLGTPVSPEQQEYLNQQFSNRLAWLQEQFRNRG
jgi:hypothetical protein